MPSTEQIPERVFKVGENKVEIQGGLMGDSVTLSLKDANQRLENLHKQKGNFASQEAWQKQIDVTKEAIAMLGGVDTSKKVKSESKIANFFKKVTGIFKGK